MAPICRPVGSPAETVTTQREQSLVLSGACVTRGVELRGAQLLGLAQHPLPNLRTGHQAATVCNIVEPFQHFGVRPKALHAEGQHDGAAPFPADPQHTRKLTENKLADVRRKLDELRRLESELVRLVAECEQTRSD